LIFRSVFKSPIGAIPAEQRFHFGDVRFENRGGIFALFGSHFSLVWTDVALLISEPAQMPNAQKIKNRIDRSRIICAEILVLNNQHLVARKKLEDPLDLR